MKDLIIDSDILFNTMVNYGKFIFRKSIKIFDGPVVF